MYPGLQAKIRPPAGLHHGDKRRDGDLCRARGAQQPARAFPAGGCGTATPVFGGALPSRRAGKRAQFLGRVLRSWLLPVIFNTVLTGSGRASLNTRFRSLAE